MGWTPGVTLQDRTNFKNQWAPSSGRTTHIHAAVWLQIREYLHLPIGHGHVVFRHRDNFTYLQESTGSSGLRLNICRPPFALFNALMNQAIFLDCLSRSRLIPKQGSTFPATYGPIVNHGKCLSSHIKSRFPWIPCPRPVGGYTQSLEQLNIQ
jgi:hypothetical protein